MTLQQLEYLVAIDDCRSFSAAADQCFVTQPSLSAMVMKLEAELGLKLFDRSKQPVTPTEIGAGLIVQARLVLREAEKLRQLAKDQQEKVNGTLRVGVIPTLAPYLLPLFLRPFSERYPEVELHIAEAPTEQIIQQLHKDQLDVGLMATPLGDDRLTEDPLFWEEFFVYAPKEPSILQKQYLMASDIDPDRLVLLEEGHCIRTQVINLCALQKAQRAVSNVAYEAGSLETLRRVVENHAGITILPELALLDLDKDRLRHVRFFKKPSPAREVSLVAHRACVKTRLVGVLREVIMAHLPAQIKDKKEEMTIISARNPV
jgi:LysR family hydrogen peroxide-inducible transcriptional activator